MLKITHHKFYFRCNGLTRCTVEVLPQHFSLATEAKVKCHSTPLYLEVQYVCLANLSSVIDSEIDDKLAISNMGANISKFWSDGDRLLSPDIVEKAVQEGILNRDIPVTQNYVDDNLMVENNEDLVMTSLNSPRMKTLDTIQHNYEMYVDSSDSIIDSDDIDDREDESDSHYQFTYREILIITMSSSILIIIAVIIAVVSFIQKHRKKYLSTSRPDLIPMSGKIMTISLF